MEAATTTETLAQPTTTTGGATKRRLDDDEKALAAEWWDAALRLAKASAGRFARGVDAHDVAVNGLLKAIRTNRARTEARPFHVDLSASIYCATVDALRDRTGWRRKHKLRQVPFSVINAGRPWVQRAEDSVLADEPPVGFADDAVDALEELVRKTKPSSARALRTLYLDPSCKSQLDVARKLGLSESRVCQLVSEGHRDIAHALGGDARPARDAG